LTLADELAACASFVVAFGDDVLLGGTPGTDLVAMGSLAADTSADAIIAAQAIDRADIGSFGVVDLTEASGNRVAAIRQRPDPATVAEPLAVVSRLILRPGILDRLVARPEASGEVDLGAAVGEQARAGDVRVQRLGAAWVTVGEPHRYADALARFECGDFTASPQAVAARA
jgi:UTP--glucose-1-phosphate uridylyltransferase